MPIRVGVAGTTQFLDDRIIFSVSPSDPVGVGTAQGGCILILLMEN